MGAGVLEAGETATFAIGFDPGTFRAPVPCERTWPFTVLPWVLLGMLATATVLIVVFRRVLWRHHPGRGIIIPEYEGPDELGIMPAATLATDAVDRTKGYLSTGRRSPLRRLVFWPGIVVYCAITDVASYLLTLQSPEGAVRERIDPDDPAAVVRLYERLLPWAVPWGVERQWAEVLASTTTGPSSPRRRSGSRRGWDRRTAGSNLDPDTSSLHP